MKLTTTHKVLIGLGISVVLFAGRKQIVSASTALYDKFKGITETQPEMKPFLVKIWQHLGYSHNEANWHINNRTPWSAAFISWLMRSYPDFPKHASHSYYITQARDNQGKFELQRVDLYKPQVGDIVCRSRAGVNSTFDGVKFGDPTHCDLVIDIKPGKLITIGGNLSNGIGMSNVSTKNGYIADSRYFAIIKNKYLNK